MELETISQVVSTLGFPIFCCCYLMYQHTQTLEFFKRFADEMNKTLDGNTKALTELVTLIKDYFGGKE